MELLKEYKGYLIFIAILYIVVFILYRLPQPTRGDFLIQKFSSGKYSLTITGYKESSIKILTINKSGKKYSLDINDFPIQITAVFNDSIFIDYLIFSNRFRDTIEYQNIENMTILVKQYKAFISTLSENASPIDSIINTGGQLKFFYKGLFIDSASQGTLQFDGKLFFKRRIDTVSKIAHFTNFVITDENFLKSYKKEF